ncbi:MAG TPA: DUF6767 domain-containing protein [Marmoricola sp.]|nr:DUF6767 domain-containing protein [Marmoricola sp.]
MSADANAARGIRRSRPVPRCPLQPGVACTLCKPGVSGPEDCPAVYLVMSDPDLREELARLRRSLS